MNEKPGCATHTIGEGWVHVIAAWHALQQYNQIKMVKSYANLKHIHIPRSISSLVPPTPCDHIVLRFCLQK